MLFFISEMEDFFVVEMNHREQEQKYVSALQESLLSLYVFNVNCTKVDLWLISTYQNKPHRMTIETKHKILIILIYWLGSLTKTWELKERLEQIKAMHFTVSSEMAA